MRWLPTTPGASRPPPSRCHAAACWPEHATTRDARRFGIDGRRARRQVPHRRRRLHHRRALLQGPDQHRHARRQPVEHHRHAARRRTFSTETATGWQQVNCSRTRSRSTRTPTYVVSYFAPNGGYAIDRNYFASSGDDNGVLHAPSDAAARRQRRLRLRPHRRLSQPDLRRDQLLGRRRVPERHRRTPRRPTVTQPHARQRRDQRRDRRRGQRDVQRVDGRHHHQRNDHRAAQRRQHARPGDGQLRRGDNDRHADADRGAGEFQTSTR